MDDKRSASSGAQGAVGTTFVISTIKALFRMESCSESETARYNLQNEAGDGSKSRAGGAPLITHELARHLIKTEDLTLDPVALSTDVQMGFRQFDHEPGRGNARLAIEEGFSEWLRRRETNQLQSLTREQQAASQYAEEMLAARPGITEKIDCVRVLLGEFARHSPRSQAGTLIERLGRFQGVWMPQLAATLMLLWALNPSNPYEFYVLLRWVCCPVFVYLAAKANAMQLHGWIWVLGFTALVYNPVFQFHFNKETWSVINVITIGIAIASVFVVKKDSCPRRQAAKPGTGSGAMKPLPYWPSVLVPIVYWGLVFALLWSQTTDAGTKATRRHAYTNRSRVR